MRIAASTYLNSAPLVYSFAQGSLSQRYTFLGDAAPARCAALLAGGAAELALIPAIEYQRIPDLRLIPEVAVASKREVRSVLLASRRPTAEVRSVALDPASRTSQALVRILFARRYGHLPQFSERAATAVGDFSRLLGDCDAALVIGDPALKLAAVADGLGLQLYDLAAEWRALTGLPIVFAVWAMRAGVDYEPARLVADFVRAKREGVAQIPALAASFAREMELPEAQLLGYLRENVNFELDEENLAGLRHYFQLAAECGLIEEAQPLQFA